MILSRKQSNKIKPTNFHQRAANDFANDILLMDYTPFLTEMNILFSSFGDNSTASAEDVAKTVYMAVTGDTDTLRSIAGPDPEPLIAIRNMLTYAKSAYAEVVLIFCDGAPSQKLN